MKIRPFLGRVKIVALFLFVASHPSWSFSIDDSNEVIKNVEGWNIQKRSATTGGGCVGVRYDDRILDNGNALSFKLTGLSELSYIQKIELLFDENLNLPGRSVSSDEIYAGAAILRNEELKKALSSRKLTINFYSSMSARYANVDLRGVAEAIAFIKDNCANSNDRSQILDSPP